MLYQVYRNPETSETQEEFNTLEDAIKESPPSPEAEIVCNGIIFAREHFGKWVHCNETRKDIVMENQQFSQNREFDNSDNVRFERRSRKTNDPQTVVTGRLKEGSNTELITFTYQLTEHLELVCIVNIPPEGQSEAPVYVKQKVRQQSLLNLPNRDFDNGDRDRDDNGNRRPRKTNDPQTVVMGRLKDGSNTELITFSFPVGGHLELVFIVNIPPDDQIEAPVYVKEKVRWESLQNAQNGR